MNLRLTGHLVGILSLFVALSMLAPLAVSFIYRDGTSLYFIQAIVLTILASLLLVLLCRRRRGNDIRHREGMAVVALSWFFAGVFGALPFYLAGTFPTFLDCLFESLSGFTTTGASVLTEIESLPHAILFWRSLTHWLGGMGIIVLTIAILPFLGVGGMQLFKAEVPGPVADKLQPRVTETAKLLWKVYLAFTGAEVLLLHVGGMNLFDSFCHTFGTLATGGFSTKKPECGPLPKRLHRCGHYGLHAFVRHQFRPALSGLERKPEVVLPKPGNAFFPGGFRRGHAFGHLVDLARSTLQPAPVVPLRLVPGGFHPDHHRVRHGEFRTLAGLVPDRPDHLHIYRGIGRFHRRGYEVHARHAAAQAQLPGIAPPDSSPRGFAGQVSWQGGTGGNP